MKWLVGLTLFVSSTGALASFLRLVSESQLSLFDKQGQLTLQGNLTLENQGDEVAQEVSVEFALDRWSLVLPHRKIEPRQKATWEIDVQIPQEKLCLKISEDCLLSLPPQGEFQFRLTKNYQDQNGYTFSAIELLGLTYGDTPSRNSLSDGIELELKIRPEQNFVYRAEYVIRNREDRPVKLALSYLVPKEVEILHSQLPVEISSQGEWQGSFVFKNKSGLVGSEYVTLLVAEWAADQRRKFTWIPAQFRVQTVLEAPQKESWNFPAESIFLFFWAFFSLSSFLWVYLYWQRRLSK